jgi:hypothetical protein
MGGLFDTGVLPGFDCAMLDETSAAFSSAATELCGLSDGRGNWETGVGILDFGGDKSRRNEAKP